MKKILTIDQGTTSSRSIIFNKSFDIINESQQEYALSFPKDGWVEADADDILNVQGDGTTDEVLISAGIKKASNLITALPSDADNLFVVLSARQLNADCTIISRASKESSYSKLKLTLKYQ